VKGSRGLSEGLKGKADLSRSGFIEHTRKPGAYWVDFTLPESGLLAPGKYWLVLRHFDISPVLTLIFRIFM
jgi:hypothetical protein